MMIIIIGNTNFINKYQGKKNLNLSLPKNCFKSSTFNKYPTTKVVPNAPNGIKIFETRKSILSNIVPAPKCIKLKLLNDNVAGILSKNTNMLPTMATFLRFVLSFLVKFETLSSSNDIDDVNAANKNNIKNIK